MFGRWFGGGSVGGNYERGLAALRQGEYVAALAAFDASLARANEASPLRQLAQFYRAEALGHLGRRELLQGEDGAAIARLDAALAVSPTYPDLRLLRGIARLRSGDSVGAASDALEALKSNPHFLEAQMLLAATHAELHEPQLAARAWRLAQPLAEARDEALRTALLEPAPPARPELIELLLHESRRREQIQTSRALLAQGYWQRARKDFAQYVLEQPRYPDLRFGLALSAFQLGARQEAREQLEIALSLQPGYAEAGLLLAILELQEERIARAAALFELGADSPGGGGVAAYGKAACAYLLDELSDAQLRSLPSDFAGTRWLRLAVALDAGELRAVRAQLASLESEELEDAVDLALIRARLDDAEAERALELLPAGSAHPAVTLLRARAARANERCGLLGAALAQHPDSTAIARALAAAEAEQGQLAPALQRLRALPAPRCAEAQAIDLAIWRSAGRDDLLLACNLAPTLAACIARLQALRRSGQSEAALALRDELESEVPLEWALRLHDPARWARPLLRWGSDSSDDAGLLSLQA